MPLSDQEIDEKLEVYGNEIGKFPAGYIQRKKSTLNELKNKRKDSVASSEQKEKINKQIEHIFKQIEDRHAVGFVNRVYEIENVTDIEAPPYLLISAPLGYGKTRLLEAVREKLLQNENWLYIQLELSREESYSVTKIALDILRQLGVENINNINDLKPKTMGHKVGSRILQQLNNTEKNVLLQVDEAESLNNNNIVKQVLDEFILSIRDTLNKSNRVIKFRLILSGRYISTWRELGLEIPIGPKNDPKNSFLLTPFTFNTVYETVQKFLEQKKFQLDEEYNKKFASHLMYFTGGHPGCMAEILINIREIIPSLDEITENEQAYYRGIVRNVISKIRKHISACNLREIFTILSVIRRFNSSLLRHLVNSKVINWSKSEDELEFRLTQTYLVSRKDGFLQDNISRRLLSIHLRNTKFSRFLNVCKKSISFYECRLKDSKCHRPDIIAVELLFQKLQYIFYKLNGNKDDFFKEVPEILNTLIKEREAEANLQSLKELLNEDWEFCFTFNYLFRKDVYDNEYPFNELIEQVDAFMKTLRGDNNA